MRTAAAWSWRILVVAAVAALVIFLVIQLRLIVIPIMVALLLAALLVPFSNFLQSRRWPKWLAVAVSEVGIIAVVAGLVTIVVWQVRAGFPSLQEQTIAKFVEFEQFLVDSPLGLSEADITGFIDDAVATIQDDIGTIVGVALGLGGDVGEILAGALIALFATLFILIDGRAIWAWIVRLFPRPARVAVSGAGEAGWVTLTSFIKVQILVAAIDAIGIGLGALLLGVPLAIPIAVLVFLGAFVPFIGAIVTGALAVFLALVYNGPWIAFWMLVVVLGVQQIESHVLQPILMGSAVKVHPLAVVLVVAGGAMIAGIPGALFAVPLAAFVNVFAVSIARRRVGVDTSPVSADLIWSTVPRNRKTRR